jgi:CheY-like chemotaxis protein
MTDTGKTILVVDDEPDTVEFLTTVLEDNGYATLSASDGEQALALIAEKMPDLVTLDITMPESSGVGAYRAIKTDDRFKDIPVIMVTGISQDFEKFISSRKNVPPPEAYLPKPVEPEDLLEQVRRLLG